tara:strand:+ start:267 stop:662 length:396 start_codon:yes stop_codon:yes gene_type:complete
MLNVKFILLTLLISFSYLMNVKSKDYDSMHFTCADEIGPLLEFKIPDLKASKSGNFNIKTFDKIKRKSSTVREGVIKKVTSPIDDSYFFYHANTISKEKGIFEISFEFYPPSHLLIKYSNSQYSDLVCWNN